MARFLHHKELLILPERRLRCVEPRRVVFRLLGNSISSAHALLYMKAGALLLILFGMLHGRAAEGPARESLLEQALPAVVSLYSAGTGSEQATSRGVGFL